MTIQPPTAIVTGGCAGLGWEISQKLAQEGYRVLAADIVPGRSDSLPEDRALGVSWIEMDVRDHVGVRQVIDDIAQKYGSIDVLVNNAGVQRHRNLEHLTMEEWANVLNVNLGGTFSCLQAAGRHMLAAGRGSIVNVASVAARGSAGRAPYATSKAGVIGLTATAGAEWAERGIRVNAVAPGYVDTGVFREGVAAGTLSVEAILSRIPARRLARPEEIANLVSFLVSDQATYINGQTLYVDGGFTVDYGVPLVSGPK